MNIVIKHKKLDFNFYRIDYHESSGRIIPQFGVWRIRNKYGTYYDSDTHAKCFNTLIEAKQFAKKTIESEGSL